MMAEEKKTHLACTHKGQCNPDNKTHAVTIMASVSSNISKFSKE
jgi:hypothetical protein